MMCTPNRASPDCLRTAEQVGGMARLVILRPGVKRGSGWAADLYG